MSLDVRLVVGPCDDTPCVQCGMRGEHQLYTANITHNLNKMAAAADLYTVLWRADELWDTPVAAHLISLLEQGLTALRNDPASYASHAPVNGWGTYEGLVAFVEVYLAACREFPSARVTVSR